MSSRKYTKAAKELVTLRSVLRWGASLFAECVIKEEITITGYHKDLRLMANLPENSWYEAVSIVMPLLHLPTRNYEKYLDSELTQSEREKIFECYRKRIEEKIFPSYLVNIGYHAGLPFYVDKNTFGVGSIAGGAIGALTEQKFEPLQLKKEPKRILDICCGSGCIGIAAGHVFLNAKVDLADISEKALEVAQKNLDRYSHLEKIHPKINTAERFKTIQSDFYKNITHRDYDLILANPPWADEKLFKLLPEEQKHQPLVSLIGHEESFGGYESITLLLTEAYKYMSDDGIFIGDAVYFKEEFKEIYSYLPFQWFTTSEEMSAYYITKKDLEHYFSKIDK